MKYSIFVVLILLFHCASTKSKFGYIDLKGNWSIPPEYEDAEDFSEGYALVVKKRSLFSDEKWFFIDKQGKQLGNLFYLRAFSFQEGLALVGDRYHYGFIDKNGNSAIEIQYLRAYSFKNGYALVAKDRRFKTSSELYDSFDWHYIDKKGNTIVRFASYINQPETWHLYASEGMFPVFCGRNGWGFVSLQGNPIPCDFSKVFPFSEGMAAVGKYGVVEKGELLYGYSDKSGKLIIPYRYKYAGPFKNGLAVVSEVSTDGERDGVFYYIDKTGKRVFSETFERAYDFSEGLAFVIRPYEEKRTLPQYGFINLKGEVMFSFSETMGFSCGFRKNGLAAVNLTPEVIFDERKGYLIDTNGSFIDTKGKIVYRFPGLGFAAWSKAAEISCVISEDLIRRRVTYP